MPTEDGSPENAFPLAQREKATLVSLVPPLENAVARTGAGPLNSLEVPQVDVPAGPCAIRVPAYRCRKDG
ncbi:hypothetical protein [Actinokineospora pegani]|uniref:hypothetical protein n=1 Tax=Actinokineospora pegani TaxID=2654637 RepID=UPI0012E99E00|nr:hypothetical protein [Actinokineospora pegani]